MTKKKLGIIQSRGLGDLVIGLPIAHHYAEQGWDIYWPIAQEFMSSMTQGAPWVHWVPRPVDAQGNFFYDLPMARLKNFKCEEIICLYQHLTGHPELQARPEFQITGFDQIKYSEAGVPFWKKWTLGECLVRDTHREQQLYDQVVGQDSTPYVVVHLDGSDHSAQIDPSWIPQGWRTVKIQPVTDSIFDWLTVIERAQAVITVDSVYANLIDQLRFTDTVDCYFIPRSHIQLTPVLGGTWTYLSPSPEVTARIKIFA